MTTTIEITLNGRDYPVACSEAEATRIQDLAKQLNARTTNLQAQMGTSVSDAHLLVMVNLMLLDELADAQLKAVVAQETAQEAMAMTAQQILPDEQKILVSAVRHLTGRVNSIAEKLKAA